MGGPQVNNRSPVLVTRCHYQVRVRWGYLYSEVQCIMDNVHMEPHCGQTIRHTQLKTLPSHNFGGGSKKLTKRGC